MKKRILLIMGLCTLLLVGGCTKNDVANNSTEDNTADGTTLTAITKMPVKKDYKARDYITLGKYKGIAVSVLKSNVTDSEVDASIQSALAANKTYATLDKTVVETGDIVNIDYEGLLDGVAFEGGTATDYKLNIGSNSFIDGFESGLIGKKVGEAVALDITFPADYGNEMAGKAVVFNVTVKAIVKEVIPELTLDYVKANTDYDTIDAYKKSIRDTLEANKKSAQEDEKYNNAYTAVIAASTISSIPESLTKYYTDLMTYQVSQDAATQGMDLEAYLTKNSMTVESYNQYAANYAKNYADQDILIKAISDVEKIKITDKEYNAALKTFMSEYQMDTEEALLAVIPKSEIIGFALSQKVMDFVVKNAVITEADPTPTPAATTAPAAE